MHYLKIQTVPELTDIDIKWCASLFGKLAPISEWVLISRMHSTVRDYGILTHIIELFASILTYVFLSGVVFLHIWMFLWQNEWFLSIHSCLFWIFLHTYLDISISGFGIFPFWFLSRVAYFELPTYLDISRSGLVYSWYLDISMTK